MKCDGLGRAQLTAAHPPRSLTLAGLLKHGHADLIRESIDGRAGE
jgi:hypothetical protein